MSLRWWDDVEDDEDVDVDDDWLDDPYLAREEWLDRRADAWEDYDVE